MQSNNNSSDILPTGNSPLKVLIFKQLEFLESNHECPVTILEKRLEWFKAYLVDKKVISQSAVNYINVGMVIEEYLKRKGFEK